MTDKQFNALMSALLAIELTLMLIWLTGVK